LTLALLTHYTNNKNMAKIYYKSGYKFQLNQTLKVLIPITGFAINREFFTLDTKGNLTVFKNYAWDGASGFPDIKSIIRASLVHDVLYQAMRLKLLPADKRKAADEILKKLCLEDGMNPLLATTVYNGVRALAANAIYAADNPVLTAP
jgi:hypothetical protein